MMTISRQRNIGSFLSIIPAIPSLNAVAGSGDDGDAKEGPVIDRRDYNMLSLSAVLAIGVTTSSLGPATATLEVSISDSADGDTFDPFDETIEDVVYDTDDNFIITHNINLGSARRYIRVNYEITFSAGATDAAVISAALIYGGFDELPVTTVPGGASD